MDTRFWGPSGWQLFHLIAFAQHARDAETLRRYELFFNGLKDILPCKFCRASTAEFMETELPLHPRVHDTARWLYELHNRVNRKLREQAKTDSNVRDPGPDPTFEEVRERYAGYLAKAPNAVPGADFLTTIALNYPEKPTSEHVETHTQFWDGLRILFPFARLRGILAAYMDKHPLYPALQSRAAYSHWVHGALKRMCRRGTMVSYQGMCQQTLYFKSECERSTYRGKTCRRTKDGKYHKVRDHARTYRLTHSRLLK